jgi:hypothetical protein
MALIVLYFIQIIVMHDVTRLLKDITDGDGKAPEELLPLVYDELKKLASSYMRNERQSHTLQTTALVHEAYIRLVDWKNVSWQNRAHFFCRCSSANAKDPCRLRS